MNHGLYGFPFGKGRLLDTRVPKHAGDDDFDGPQLDTNWQTVVAAGSATWAQGNGSLGVWFSGMAGGNAICLLKPCTIAMGGYIETKMRVKGYPTSNNNPALGGLVLTDGLLTSSNLAFVGGIAPGGPGGGGIFFNGGNVAGFNATPGGLASEHLLGGIGDFYLRLIWLSANTFRCNISLGGDVWHTTGIADVSWTMTPKFMGFAVSDFGSGNPGGLASFDYLHCHDGQ